MAAARIEEPRGVFKSWIAAAYQQTRVHVAWSIFAAAPIAARMRSRHFSGMLRPKVGPLTGADQDYETDFATLEFIRCAEQEEPPDGAILIERGIRQFGTATVGLQVHRRR